MDLKQCYEILEIDETASLPQIKQAYRDMIGIWHPDRYVQNPRLYAKATEKLKALNAAYNELITRLTPGITNPRSNHKASPNQKPYILIVTCPNCHQKNRLKAGFVTHHPRCGSCSSLLFQKSHGPGKPDKKTKTSSQQHASNTRTKPNTPKNHFGTKPFFSQADETIFQKPTKKKRLLNKWTLLAILVGMFLIINNFSDLSAWLSKHFQPLIESRFTEYIKLPIAKVHHKLDNTDNSATRADIQKLLSEAGYTVDTSADVADDQIRSALKQFRHDYSLSFRLGS